jgi:hypothetical protein
MCLLQMPARFALNRGAARSRSSSFTQGDDAIASDYTQKMLHMSWHPEANVIAAAASNSLYIFYVSLSCFELLGSPDLGSTLALVGAPASFFPLCGLAWCRDGVNDRFAYEPGLQEVGCIAAKPSACCAWGGLQHQQPCCNLGSAVGS